MNLLVLILVYICCIIVGFYMVCAIISCYYLFLYFCIDEESEYHNKTLNTIELRKFSRKFSQRHHHGTIHLTKQPDVREV